MTDEVTPTRFHEVGWRVMAYAAGTHYRTGSLAEGARLAEAVADVVAGTSQRAHIDVRSDGVTVRLFVDERGELTEQDIVLAGQIAAVAQNLGVEVDLNGLRMIQVAIDALSIPDVTPFWQAVLGYQVLGDTL